MESKIILGVFLSTFLAGGATYGIKVPGVPDSCATEITIENCRVPGYAIKIKNRGNKEAVTSWSPKNAYLLSANPKYETLGLFYHFLGNGNKNGYQLTYISTDLTPEDTKNYEFTGEGKKSTYTGTQKENGKVGHGCKVDKDGNFDTSCIPTLMKK